MNSTDRMLVLKLRAGQIFSTLGILCLGIVFLLATMDQADARRRHRGYVKHRVAHHYVKRNRNAYTPPYAEIVVDINSGKVLTATNADAPRHPASITKVMTLYMLFEQMERGRMSLDTPLRVSSHAASQSPSKLGLRPGSTIDVEDAIKAVVTRSANDVASAIGENISGSEEAFAQAMTRKARSIGMSRTTFRNASGLPDPQNLTTARDLVTLGRSIQDRFPTYYKYFATRSFEYNGQMIGNHNRLLGRVEGVDGIKTGYTRASGFNLLTSAKVGGRHVIAVVLGGRSGRVRDAQMASLLDTHMENASAGGRRNIQLAEAEGDADEDVAPRVPVKVAAPVAVPVAPTASRPVERPKPAVVAELTRQKAEPAKAEPVPAKQQLALNNPRPAQTAGVTPIRIGAVQPVAASTTPSGPIMRWNAGSQPKALAQTDIRVGQPTDPAQRKALGLRAAAELNEPTTTGSVSAKTAQEAVVAAKPEKLQKQDHPAASAPARTGWIIQVAATDDETKAKAILAAAKSKNKLLASAESFTETVQKGNATLYRARFGGFESVSAETACKSLKKTGYACFVQHI